MLDSAKMWSIQGRKLRATYVGYCGAQSARIMSCETYFSRWAKSRNFFIYQAPDDDEVMRGHISPGNACFKMYCQ
jgi:hypothetical protein